MWHNCCVKQIIYSLSVKTYSKVNTIIFSSAIVWLLQTLQTFFFLPFSHENLLTSVLQVSDMLRRLYGVCGVFLLTESICRLLVGYLAGIFLSVHYSLYGSLTVVLKP